MSQSIFRIKCNVSSENLRLLPDRPIEIDATYKFDADGVLDFEDLLGQLLTGIEANMGKLKHIGQSDRNDLKIQMANGVIKGSIHTVSDVLNAFYDDGDPYCDAQGRLCLPLRMNGSKRRLDLTPRFDANGELDLDDLVACFEKSYHGVLSQVDQFNSANSSILSSEQKSAIRRGGQAWVTEKAGKIGMSVLRAVAFELITDDECWLRGSGEITVSMVIKYAQSNSSIKPRQIKVYSPNNAFFDLDVIVAQLAEMLTDFLKSQESFALSLFSGATKESMLKEWKNDAVQWLVDDIRADLHVFDYLQYRPVEGRKIIIENAFRQGPIELDIKFQDGVCWFEIMADQISTEVEKHFTIKEFLTNDQRRAAAKAMAPAIVEAVRDKNFCHPYSQDTKNKLLEMAKYIKIAATQVSGVSTLALAGAVADALDDNLEERLQQAYDLAEKNLLKAIRSNTDKAKGLVDIGLAILSLFDKEPLGGTVLETVKIIWACMPEAAKNDATDKLGLFGRRALYFLGEEIVQSIAHVRDEENDSLVKLELKSKIDPAKLNQLDAAKLRNELKQLIIKSTNPAHILCNYAFADRRYRGKIIQNAKAIDHVLSGHKIIPTERDNATKWERFYHYFS